MNKRIFYTLSLRSLILNLGWAFIGSLIYTTTRDADRLGITQNADAYAALLQGLGFIIIYGLTFFLSMAKRKKTVSNFVVLTIIFGGIFFISSIIVPITFNSIESDYGDYIGALLSSLVAAISIVTVIRNFFEVRRRIFTIALTTIAAFCVTIIFIMYMSVIADYTYEGLINPLAIGYGLWQSVTTIAVAQSIVSNTPH